MVAIDQMKDKLLTLEQVSAILSETEPLNQRVITSADKTTFVFEPTWAIGLEDKEGYDTVEAVVRINNQDHQLTKDAALQAGAAFGLPGKYAQKQPSQFLERDLNHWYGPGMVDAAFNLLTTGYDQTVAAFAKPTIHPFSNTLLVNEVVQKIVERYGTRDIYADYKFNHSLVRTDVRFIIPEINRVIHDGGMTDVPSGQLDEWAGGIHLTNSLIGKSQTKLDTYLFRYWCTNGETVSLNDLGVYSRRRDHEENDVYLWARNAVEHVLGSMERNFDQVQGLTQLELGANTGEVLGEIFETYRVPVHQRKEVQAEMEEAETLSMYTVMNAITRTANDPDISEDRMDKLMRIGGAITSSTFNGLKAKIWEEGHTADPDYPNPYDLKTA